MIRLPTSHSQLRIQVMIRSKRLRTQLGPEHQHPPAKIRQETQTMRDQMMDPNPHTTLQHHLTEIRLQSPFRQ